ncbi:MAG: protein BatD [Magnetococcales bacterium]|nr:protein BatD [Magnetococcales bacterium]
MVNWHNKQKSIIKSYFAFCLSLLSILLVSTTAIAAQITVSIDQDQVLVSESFKLIFEAKGSVDGEPDFSPLKKSFDILGQNKSTSYQFINGSGHSSTSWTVNLIPREAGKFTIPAIKFGSSTSKPITLIVNKDPTPTSSKGQFDSDMFLLVEADTHKPYVQAQVVITLRFYRAIKIVGATMTKPNFSGGEVVFESLGQGRQYDTNRNNRKYRVEEHRYIMFPQKSGELKLTPIHLKAQIGGSNQVFGNLFNDPFGRQRSSVKRISSNTLKFDVQAIPKSFTHKRWLAAHEVIISQKWSQDPAQFIVGEPITRTINLMADGIPAKQLPKFSKQKTTGLKQYTDKAEHSDQVELTGIVGVLRQKNAIIPTSPGTYKLAAIEIPWWDVDEDKLKIARLHEQTITVQPAVNSNQPAKSQQLPLPESSTPPTTLPTTTVTPAAEMQHTTQPYPWLAVVFGVGWFLTALAWWFHHRSWQKNVLSKVSKTVKEIDTNILKKLKASSLDNRPSETRRLLMQWASQTWPDLNSPSMAKICELVQPSMATELEKLEQTLYAKEPIPWDGAKLWSEIKGFKKTKSDTKSKKHSGELSPLY